MGISVCLRKFRDLLVHWRCMNFALNACSSRSPLAGAMSEGDSRLFIEGSHLRYGHCCKWFFFFIKTRLLTIIIQSTFPSQNVLKLLSAPHLVKYLEDHSREKSTIPIPSSPPIYIYIYIKADFTHEEMFGDPLP